MIIKIKRDNKYINVDVSCKECPKYECFGIHKYIHYGRSISGQDTSWQEKYYSCCNRNYHGCPDNPKRKLK